MYKTKEVAHRLASGIWTHDFPITVETAKELIGLPISTEIPGEVFLVTTLYPQAQQAQLPITIVLLGRARTVPLS